MKIRFVILIMFLAVVTPPALPQQTQGPLTKDQVMGLVKYGMSSADLAEKIKKLSIDFEPTDDYLQALRQAGAQEQVIQALRAVRPKALTQDQVGKLVAGGVPSERAATLVKQRGVDFLADEQYLEMLRLAGADDALIAAVREASAAATAQVVVETSPNAEVYLDGELKGHANAQGELTFKAKLGAHALKVSLVRKEDFEQNLTLTGRQATQIEARLVDAPGSVRLRTLAGASISLDGASRGSTDASGELVLTNIPPGPHELRVSAPRKKDYRQSVTVLGGKESRLEATLEDVGPGTVQENPKDALKYVWILPGTFMMGCSPGDKECYPDEKPPHQVTITKGFWMGQTEVTVAAYKRFAAATGRPMPPEPNYNGRPLNPGWGDEAMPIVDVTWDDAQAYCRWAGGRLPTEAEWEYAARAGSTASRYGDLDEIAWYVGNCGRQRLDSRILNGDPATNVNRESENGNSTHDVGLKRANSFGLYDMLGNVREWVNDQNRKYAANPERDPRGPDIGQNNVQRGGSWDDRSGNVRVSTRVIVGGGGAIHVGFRCAGEAFAP